MKRLHFLALTSVVGLTLAGCPAPSSNTTTTTPDAVKPAGGDGKVQQIAFVTNNVSEFWTSARKGVEQAAKETPSVSVEFQMPDDGSAAKQKEILDTLVAKGVKGIAVSPVDPKNMTADLDALAAKATVICHDSDAPDSKRACYIGTDNVAAGRMAGEEVKKALPNGGKIMVFVGKKDAQNAQERYKGLEESLKGSKVQILDIRTDDTDRARAKQNAADTITGTPDIAGMVGLWSYNGPAIINAVKEAKKTNAIKIVCFDDEEQTLQAIKEGVVTSTIVQQPYEFGYQSVKMLAAILSGDKNAIPADKKKIIETKVIDKAGVEAYQAKLKELTGK